MGKGQTPEQAGGVRPVAAAPSSCARAGSTLGPFLLSAVSGTRTQSPRAWRQTNGAAPDKAHVWKRDSRSVYLANTSFFFSQPAATWKTEPRPHHQPWRRGSRDALAAGYPPAVKAQSLPLPAPAGLAVLARAAPSWPRRDLLQPPGTLISWRRCRRGRSRRGSSPGAPRPGGAARRGG